MTDKEKDIFNRKFNRWLDEWELEQELRIDGSDSQSIEAKHQIPFEEPIYKDIKAGDILLLSSELNSKGTGLIDPLFIAILRLWEKEDNNEFFLWAPYSPFTQPATDKEIKFENSDPRLSVLSLWNAHTSPKQLLSESWFIDELEEKNRKDALKVFWYSLGMEELTPKLVNQTGPKLFNSRDPRKTYIIEELSRTACIREKSIPVKETESYSEDPCIIIFPNPLIFLQAALAAASDDERESSFEEYTCKELPIKVSLQYIPRHEQIVIHISTDDKDLKYSLDEFKVKLIDDDKPYLTFENGDCVHPISLKSIRFTLVSPDGKNLTLIKDTNN